MIWLETGEDEVVGEVSLDPTDEYVTAFDISDSAGL